MTNPTDTRALQALVDKVEAGNVLSDLARAKAIFQQRAITSMLLAGQGESRALIAKEPPQ